jgi:CRISPR/Cas system CMR subunit Cmr4 (Cas7 group RAMP superfamily)
MLKDALELLAVAGLTSEPLWALMKDMDMRGRLVTDRTPVFYGKVTMNLQKSFDTEAGYLHAERLEEHQIALDGFGNFLALLSDTAMRELLEEVPVIARNVLDNGISQNVWYEEAVPRKAQFLTVIWTENQAFSPALNEALTTETVQIGANATVGWGVCRFHQV